MAMLVHRSWSSHARVVGVFLLNSGLVHLHGNCASCMVNTLQLFEVIIGFILFISIRSCVSVVSPI